MVKKTENEAEKARETFAVLNESSLHKALKKIYTIQNNGKTEVQIDKWICDIVTEDNDIIEIQNKNVSSLKEKAEGLINLGYKLTIVHPIITEKIIITSTKNNTIESKRKSPKKDSLYSMLKELTGLAPLLKNPSLILEIPEIHTTENRIRTEEPVQSRNNNRRWLKTYLKIGKDLTTIGKIHIFRSKKDYLKLLPPSLPENFSSKELKEAFSLTDRNAVKYINLLLWVLYHADFIERTEKKGKLFYYKIK